MSKDGQLTLKQLVEITYELFQKSDPPAIRYLGNGLYTVYGFILTEEMINEWDKEIIKLCGSQEINTEN